MRIENFELMRPIPLFDAVWDRTAMAPIPSDDSDVHVGDTFEFVDVSLPFPPYKVPYPRTADIWGIPWSPLPESAWNPHLKTLYREVGRYAVAYLRLELTLYNGRPGDTMLFLFNQPGTPHSAGLHARVHIQIQGAPLSSGDATEPRRTTAIEQHLIRGYPEVADMGDGAAALHWMQEVTRVRFLGLSPEEGLRLQACATLLGGMY
ncbi:MAG: hypothetical protein AB1486_12935 [Planctomycetota bacterium]